MNDSKAEQRCRKMDPNVAGYVSRNSLQSPGFDRQFLFFAGCERNVGIAGREQVARSVLAVAALAQPVFQLLPCRRRQLRKEQPGAPLVAGPNYIRLAVQRDLSTRQHTAER